MAEYHVGCGAFGIYAGTINKKGDMWINSTECTDEAVIAVCDYLRGKIEDGKNSFGYRWTLKDGRTVSLRVVVQNAEMREVDDG